MPEYKVLVVDDQFYIRNLVDVTLAKKGIEVITANNGKEAVLKAKEESPDLIIMDISMPEMNGLQAGKEIKGDQATKSIPIIFLTVSDKKKDLMNAIGSGAAAYIVKPFKLEVLTNKVIEVLENAKKAAVNQEVSEFLNEPGWQESSSGDENAGNSD